MKNPTSSAWSQDSFWRDVVAILTSGKKLRGEHYLQKLSASELDSLRLALSSSGTFLEQQKLCPARHGGATDGELPGIALLSEISQAMRQANVLREMQTQRLAESAAKGRCAELGLDPTLTNAVVRIVGEEALDQKTKQQVGSFAISVANVLLMAEGMRTKGKQEEVKIELKKKAEKRMQEKLDFEREKLKAAEAKIAATREQVAKLRDVKAPLTDADRLAIVDKIDEIMGIPKGKY